MADSKLRDMSTEFAVKVIKVCDSVKGHYSLVNQLERSATSIGANIREAAYAHGKADFIAKLQISLKKLTFRSVTVTFWLFPGIKLMAPPESAYCTAKLNCLMPIRQKSF